MPCYHPRKGHRNERGRIVASAPVPGFEDAFHQFATAQSSCGQCAWCRKQKTREWAVRIMHEASLHEQNSFITLTYNDQNLPNDKSLHLEHWKLFRKRLRHHVGQFRFFHCGEYGTDPNEVNNLGRPHYHACLFGQNFLADRQFYKRTRNGDRLYTSLILEKAWGLGYATIGELTLASAAYVAGYVMKKRTGRALAEGYYDHVDQETGECTPRQAEYATMSTGGRGGKGGIGKDWFDRWKDDVYPDDFIYVNGKKTRPPSYYDRLLERVDPKLIAGLKEDRIAKAEENAEDNTFRRLGEKERVQLARESLYRRANL